MSETEPKPLTDGGCPKCGAVPHVDDAKRDKVLSPGFTHWPCGSYLVECVPSESYAGTGKWDGDGVFHRYGFHQARACERAEALATLAKRDRRIAELENGFGESWKFLWKEYALADDSTLTPGAIELKHKMREVVGIDRLEAELARLRGAVNTYPKTADGAIIGFGDGVWGPDWSNKIMEWRWGVLPWADADYTRALFRKYHSSRELAQAALRESKPAIASAETEGDEMGRTPKRIQRKRTKGWRMPEGAVYVGRPTKWGNPFDWGDYVDRLDMEPPEARTAVVEDFRACLEGRDTPGGHGENAARKAFKWISKHVQELRGKDLVCWCPLDQMCHADVLLELANR